MSIFSGMEVFVFWLEVTDVYHHWLKKWLGADQATDLYPNLC